MTRSLIIDDLANIYRIKRRAHRRLDRVGLVAKVFDEHHFEAGRGDRARLLAQQAEALLDMRGFLLAQDGHGNCDPDGLSLPATGRRLIGQDGTLQTACTMRLKDAVDAMTIQFVAAIIQLIIAPAVMVTACGIILTSYLARYAAINDRLRLMARERLELLREILSRCSQSPSEPDALVIERINQIDTQVPELLGRHRQLRDVILTVYGAIGFFVASMIVIAAAAMTGIGWIAQVALGVFLVGLAALLAAVLLSSIELSISHRALEYELRRVLELDHTSSRQR